MTDDSAPLPPPAPRVGDVVHSVSYGTPGGEYAPACRAAVVTEVSPWVESESGGPTLGLCVLNPTGVFFRTLDAGGCRYDAGGETPGDPRCPSAPYHGDPWRYCDCGWVEARYAGGTWHAADHP